MKKKKQYSPEDFERRYFALEMRAVEDERREVRLVGHAAVFNQETRIFSDVFELIEPGAFTKTIQEGDARAFWNHNSDIVLGRRSNATLKLAEDATGLATEIFPPDTSLVRDMAISPIQRGDVKEMSFGFRVVRYEIEEREDESILFRLKEVQLFEVSPVALPAYPGTEISARSRERIEEFRQQRHAADSESAPGQAAHPEREEPEPTPAIDHPEQSAPADTRHLDEDLFSRLELAKRGLRVAA